MVKEWSYDDSFAILTPLCVYTLEFSFTDVPLFVETESTGEVAAQTLERSLAGNYIVGVTATVIEQPDGEADMSIYGESLLTLIDPCLTTRVNSVVVPELFQFQGYEKITSDTYSFDDSTN